MATERADNARLRRVDWRFLLTVEHVPAAVCRAPRALRHAVAAVTRTGGRDEVDLVVLVNPGRRALRAAYARLQPGGEVYLEWWLPLSGGRDGARRRLQAAGFTDVRCHWPWPPPARGLTRFWLPLDAPEALAAHLSPRTSLGPLARAATAVWHAARRTGLLVPVCAIARKPGPEGAAVTADLRARWGAQRVSWLLVTSGARSINKAVGLAFADDEPDPRAAVKFARTPATDEAVHAEAAHLELVRRARPRLRGVPEVIGVGRVCGRAALVQSAVRGRPLTATGSLDTLPRHADAVTAWLVDLAGATALQPRAAWWERLVEEPLRAFEAAFAGVVDDGEIARTRDLLSSVHAAPVVFEHRDCSPWNVLADDDGAIAVVDWESSEPAGLAGLDLEYFLIHAAAFAEGREHWWSDSGFLARLRDPSSQVGAVVDRCEARYCESVGLDRTSLAALRLLCWVVHSRSEHERLVADRTPPADSVFLQLWRHDLRALETEPE